MRPLSLLAALSALLLNSCFAAGDGQEPPLQSLYFPTGLTLDTVSTDDGAPRYLYVASSDFDLQYRSSALASYDLSRVSEVVPRSCTAEFGCAPAEHCDTEPTPMNGNVPSYFCLAAAGAPPCGAFGDRSAADRLLNPGRCSAVDPVHPKDHPARPLLHDTVGIGAFATNVIFRRAPPEAAAARYPARLFLPVRGDATLHWIDLEDGKFNCGQSNNSDHSCDGLHRSGDVSSDNDDQLRQQSEPFAVDATSDGTSVAVTNQTTGSVSLYVTPPEAWGDGPKLANVLGGLPSAPVAIAAIPAPHADLYSSGQLSLPGFLVAYRNAAQVDLLRVRTDPSVAVGTSYTRHALLRTGSVPITTNSIGFDSRGMVIDDEERRADYALCAPRDRDCLLRARQPKVYVANRTPASLLVGGMLADYGYTAGTSELPAFIDSIPLTAGASRVVLGHVKVPSSAAGAYRLERRVFIVCFDSRRIFVYDPQRHMIEAIISTGRGPYALVIDDARGLGYVAHFTDSYLGVISLDQRYPQTYATIVASIGTPSPPRSSK